MWLSKSNHKLIFICNVSSKYIMIYCIAFLAFNMYLAVSSGLIPL